MTDNITTDDIAPDVLDALEGLMLSIRENGEMLAAGLAEIAASVTRPNVGA